MTQEYDSGVRAHFNVFGKVVDNEAMEGEESDGLGLRDLVGGLGGLAAFFGMDDEAELDPRDFQYGAVIGADGPLCADGAVRWVADYAYRSSYYNGWNASHMGEVGWEWMITDADKLGMSVQGSIDGSDDNINYGASVVYSHSLAY
jgi:hypothetical protein